jgi:hypothetical protein
MASQNIVLPVKPEVTFKVISRSPRSIFDIILNILQFYRRVQRKDLRSGRLTFEVTVRVMAEVISVNLGLLFGILACLAYCSIRCVLLTYT